MRLLSALQLTAVLAAGCVGAYDPAGGGPAPEPDPASGAAAAFVLPRDAVRLLPFQVRLAKVARVAGVGLDDPILEPLRARRLELGDHDFAHGVRPDRSLSAARLSVWAKALQPVCASAPMRARYAALPAALPDLVLAAYGRLVEPADVAAVDEALAGLPLDDDQRYQAVCAALLSSAEFLSR